MNDLRWFKKACAVCLFLAATTIASPAQTFSLLATFTGEDGGSPEAALVQGVDGNFYGTTDLGGTGSCIPGGEGCGTVFQITAGGKLTTLYKFCSQPNCPDGNTLTAPLALGPTQTSTGRHNSGVAAPLVWRNKCIEQPMQAGWPISTNFSR
jgi:uncharacterized repeat protein (TIGR03803 family)